MNNGIKWVLGLWGVLSACAAIAGVGVWIEQTYPGSAPYLIGGVLAVWLSFVAYVIGDHA
jgi:hypothetical protein